MLNIDIVPKAYAACDPNQQGFKLTDCFILNNDGNTVASVYDKPAVLINLLMRNIFILGGIILFLMIIYSGYMMITGGTKGADQAKNTMSIAVAGFVVMFAAYWILQIIQIVTGTKLLF